jgi:hypothetical protein
MSLETWKAEFYPVPAEQCPKEQAVEHSLRKWIGARPANLYRHGLFKVPLTSYIRNGATNESLPFGLIQCALCCEYYWRQPPCCGCPLVAVLSRPCCGDATSPYRAFIMRDDPEPMIAALEAALRLEQEKAKQKAPA